MLKNRLQPFQPESLSFYHIPAISVDTLDDDNPGTEYGFERGSRQYNFFTKPPKGAVVYILATARATTLNADSVVARLFGEHVGSQLVVWHLSVRKGHPLNDSASGTRWGVYGIQPVLGTKIRWLTADGEKLNKTNARFHVKGTPNPYAASMIVQVGQALKCTLIRQHEAMPCAQLFDAQYSHKTHPATLLVYRSLGFDRSKELDAYVWSASQLPPLMDNWNRLRYCMQIGMPAVVEGLSKRCGDPAFCFHTC